MALEIKIKDRSRGNLKLAKSTLSSADSVVLEEGQSISYDDLLAILTSEIGGGGGGRTKTKQTVSANTTLSATTQTDYIVFVTAAAVITLPTAVDSTCSYTIKKKTTGSVSVVFTSGQTCEGESTILLNRENESKVFESDGTNWNIV